LIIINIINSHEDYMKIKTLQIMKLNHDYFVENNTSRILSEQIHQAKGGVKTFGIFLPINMGGRPFDFDSYCKILNNHAISFVNNDKFGVKLRYDLTLPFILNNLVLVQ